MDHFQLELNQRAARYAAILQIMCAGDAEDFSYEMWEAVLGYLNTAAEFGSSVAAAARDLYHARRFGESEQ